MTHVLRQICSLWMLLAILTASALPAGFMPNIAHAKSADGTMAPIVLCTASGYTTVYVPKDQAPQQNAPADNQQHGDHQPCPYAPAQAAGDLPQIAILTAPVIHPAVKTPFAAVQNLRAKLPQKYTRAQAPPRI